MWFPVTWLQMGIYWLFQSNLFFVIKKKPWEDKLAFFICVELKKWLKEEKKLNLNLKSVRCGGFSTLDSKLYVHGGKFSTVDSEAKNTDKC